MTISSHEYSNILWIWHITKFDILVCLLSHKLRYFTIKSYIGGNPCICFYEGKTGNKHFDSLIEISNTRTIHLLEDKNPLCKTSILSFSITIIKRIHNLFRTTFLLLKSNESFYIYISLMGCNSSTTPKIRILD